MNATNATRHVMETTFVLPIAIIPMFIQFFLSTYHTKHNLKLCKFVIQIKGQELERYFMTLEIYEEIC